MKKILVIAKKELAWYFNTPVGYVLLALFALLANFLFVKDLFLRNQATIEPLFAFIPWLMLILVAVVSMRSIAEEKKAKTLEVLLTLPVTITQVILGKFAGLGIFILAALSTTICAPITLLALGKADIGVIIASYLASIFLSFLLLAVGIFISCATKDQIAAVFTTLVVFFLIMVIGTPLITDQVPRFIRSVFFFVSPIARYINMSRGVVDVRDLVYFVSVMVGFLYLSVEILRRQS